MVFLSDSWEKIYGIRLISAGILQSKTIDYSVLPWGLAAGWSHSQKKWQKLAMLVLELRRFQLLTSPNVVEMLTSANVVAVNAGFRRQILPRRNFKGDSWSFAR